MVAEHQSPGARLELEEARQGGGQGDGHGGKDGVLGRRGGDVPGLIENVLW